MNLLGNYDDEDVNDRTSIANTVTLSQKLVTSLQKKHLQLIVHHMLK